MPEITYSNIEDSASRLKRYIQPIISPEIEDLIQRYTEATDADGRKFKDRDSSDSFASALRRLMDKCTGLAMEHFRSLDSGVIGQGSEEAVIEEVVERLKGVDTIRQLESSLVQKISNQTQGLIYRAVSIRDGTEGKDPRRL